MSIHPWDEWLREAFGHYRVGGILLIGDVFFRPNCLKCPHAENIDEFRRGINIHWDDHDHDVVTCRHPLRGYESAFEIDPGGFTTIECPLAALDKGVAPPNPPSP